MKAVKITLAIAVVGLIAFFVIKSLIFSDGPTKVTAPKNLFTERIEKEITAIAQLPENKFCPDTYKNVKYLIDDYYNSQRLGKNQSENDQWKENLSKELYSAYADQFIKQAFFVFNGSEWSSENLKFIRSEYQVLKKSPFLENGSPVDNSFSKIRQILGKYDEIVSFISSCKGFSFSDYSLSSTFPVSDVQNKISRARAYRNSNLENGYVNNCVRLHNQLKEIPQSFFNAHIRYLKNKISNWSNMWCNYNSHKDYSQNLYNPLRNEINDIDNYSNIYNVPNFASEYNNLLQIWSNDNKKAYNATYPCNQ